MMNINELFNNKELIDAMDKVDLNDAIKKANVRPTVNVKSDFDFKPILKDDHTKLKDIVSKVEDFHGIDDILSMRVEDLLIYTREMSKG